MHYVKVNMLCSSQISDLVGYLKKDFFKKLKKYPKGKKFGSRGSNFWHPKNNSTIARNFNNKDSKYIYGNMKEHLH